MGKTNEQTNKQTKKGKYCSFCERYFPSLLIVIFTLDIAMKAGSTILATVALEWQEPSLITGIAKNYVVLYKLSQRSTYWNVARTNGTQVSLKDIQPKSEYAVKVLVLTTSNITYESETFSLSTGTGTSMHNFIFRRGTF